MSLAYDPRLDRRSTGDRPIPLLRVALVVVTVLVLHGLLFRRLRVVGVGPELFLALATLGGLEFGVAGGAALGLLAGLAQDMTTTTSVGLWALVCGLLGLVMGLVHERAYSDSLRRPPFALVAVATVVALALGLGLRFVVDEAPFPSPTRLIQILVITPIWGAVVAWPLRLLLRSVVGRSR